MYDGGILSAESLGRGNSFASNGATGASGSENPASLIDGTLSSVYTTVLVDESSDLPEETFKDLDPLKGKTIQYMAIGANRGVLFFEPLARLDETQILDPSAPLTNYRDIDVSASAIGFAAAEKWMGGSIGLSFAYLYSSLASVTEQTGNPIKSEVDTGNGFRMNIGFRYPTGPAMWGLVLQNFPGYIFWKHHNRDLLPVKVRAGNTWRLHKNNNLSFDYETRFYKEGAKDEDYIYLGDEWSLSQRVLIKAGVYSNDLDDSDQHHYTGGIFLTFANDVQINYAVDQFELQDEKVTRHYISCRLPFITNK